MKKDIFTKTHLNNGMVVHLKEIHNAPLISHWVWYRTGSRNETQGKTGISHWVEHMQFKGTSQFPAGVLDKAISRDGGVWNAFTYLDWTTYFETLPADKVELALQLESDRMVNSFFDAKEVESERTVVISEREGNENEPLFRLGEAVQSASFSSHPYGHETIGYLSDLRSMTRDDLYQHYRSHYIPNNAVLSIAGDFDTSQMLELVEKYYAPIPSGLTPKFDIQPDFPPGQEQRLLVEGPGETTYLQIAYRAPRANEKDFFTLTLLDSLLTGPSSLNMFGGGISNKTSRLYRHLVEKELAISVGGGLQATIDPFLYEIIVTVHPQQKWESVLRAIDDEIKHLQDDLISIDEIIRANKQARALFAYSSENISNQAFWMGFAEMFATYDWFTHYVEELEKVTPEDLQRIARGYLAESHRVVGTYLPVELSESA